MVSSPIFNLSFYQLKAKVFGEVICMKLQYCASIQLMLRSMDGRGEEPITVGLTGMYLPR